MVVLPSWEFELIADVCTANVSDVGDLHGPRHGYGLAWHLLDSKKTSVGWWQAIPRLLDRNLSMRLEHKLDPCEWRWPHFDGAAW